VSILGIYHQPNPLFQPTPNGAAERKRWASQCDTNGSRESGQQ
jgi:hypothetical protein